MAMDHDVRPDGERIHGTERQPRQDTPRHGQGTGEEKKEQGLQANETLLGEIPRNAIIDAGPDGVFWWLEKKLWRSLGRATASPLDDHISLLSSFIITGQYQLGTPEISCW